MLGPRKTAVHVKSSAGGNAGLFFWPAHMLAILWFDYQNCGA
jgi:hypothetical protein